MAALAQCELLQEGALAGVPLPITLRSAAPMSDEELLAFSRRNEPYRIERNAQGELEIMSPVGGEGSECEASVIRDLGIWTSQHGGHAFSSSAGFRLPDGSVLSPDAAWVSETNWSSLSKLQRQMYPPLCPEFIVEIRSVSDSRLMLEAKMERWIANGARLAWMIDPIAATVSIYRAGGSVEVLQRPERVQAESVVPDFWLEMDPLWAQQ